MKATDRRTIIVGIFIFLGLVFLIAGILAIGRLNKSFTKKIAVTTIFDDVSGLQQGNNIWFSGVKIGIVKELSFYGNSQVKVVMNIEEKAEPFIHNNAKAKISSEGLIGNRLIIIYGGTPEAPTIKDGDQLQAEKTFNSDEMIHTLQENNINIASITTDFKTVMKKIAAGEGTIGQFLTNDTLYNNLRSISESLKKTSENIKQVSVSLATFGAKLNEKGTFANDLVTDTTIFSNMQTAVTRLNEIASSANEVVNNLKAASNDQETPLGVLLHDKETGADLKSAIRNIDTSAQKLSKDLEALQHNFLLRGYFKKEEKK